MKKTFIVLLVLGWVIQANAQLRDVLMKKTGEKIKKNQTEKTETQTQQTGGENGQTTTPPEENKTGDPAPTYNPYANYGGGGKKEIQPAYKFDQNVLMEMTSYDSKGKAKEKGAGKSRMYFGKEAYTGMESYDDKNVSRGFSVFETDKKQMVMLMEDNGQKTAMVMSIDPSKYSDKNAGKNEGENKSTITKTGRTKKVCGYNCEEWTSVDEKGEKTEMWVSSEVPVKSGALYSMFSGQNRGYGKYFGNSADYPQGFMMEMTHYEKNGEKFTMTTTEVNLKAPKTIETAGYTVY